MGTKYSVSCRDCAITRDLDKFAAMRSAGNRADALVIAGEIKETYSFRAALLASFMWDHRGHNCTVFCEHDEEIQKELDPFFNEDMKEDFDFWKIHGDDPPSVVPANTADH